MEGTGAKSSLPAGWVCKVSNKYQDRVYYFNIFTGCTTWECPALEAPKKSENKMTKHASILNKESLGVSTTAQQVSVLPKLSHKDISSSVKHPPHSKLIEIGSIKKKEKKRNMEKKKSLEKNHISALSSEVLQHSNTPTAIVTPVILKSKHKNSTRDSPSASLTTISQSRNMNSAPHFERTSTDPLKKLPLPSKRPVFRMEMPPASLKKHTTIKRSAASLERPTASSKGLAASLKRPASALEDSDASLKQPSASVERPAASFKRPAATVESLHSMISDIRAKSSTPVIVAKCKTTVNHVKSAQAESSLAKNTEIRAQSVPPSKKKRKRKKKSNADKRLSLPILKNVVSSSVSNSSPQNLNNIKPSCVTQSTSHQNTVPEASLHRNSISPLNNSNVEQKLKGKLEIRAERFGLNNGPKETMPCAASSLSLSASDDDSVMDFELETAPEATKVNRAESSDLDSLDDIEMLDVSSELPKMAKMIPAAPRFGNSILESFYLVVDTNVLISDLKQLENMKETPVNRCGPPHVYIPWVVLQELDYLKKSTNANRCKAAKDAIRYINSLLKAKHPRYHVQSPEEATECSRDFSRNNDDKLIECCYFLHKHMSREKVILLTNDKNLANKGMGCNILVHDCNSLLKFLKPDVLIREDVLPPLDPRSDSFEAVCRMKNKETKMKKEIKKCGVGTPLENKTDIQNCRMEIDRLMTEARRILTDILDPVFEKEMDEAYGDAWHFFPVERHTLKGILNGFMKYWRTVFEFVFSKKDKSNFELLQQKVNRPEGFLGERQECLDILSAMEDISNLLKSKRSPISTERIQRLRISIEEAFSELSACEQSIVDIGKYSEDTEAKCVLEVFQHDWSVINHVCGSALDFCKKPHEFVYDRSGELLSKSEYLRIVPELMNSLSHLKEYMEKTMEVVETGKPNSQLFKDFFQVLLEMVPVLHIPTARNPDFHNFTPKMLERFCRSPKNSSLFKSGYQQLVNFHTNLNAALLCLLFDMKTS